MKMRGVFNLDLFVKGSLIRFKKYGIYIFFAGLFIIISFLEPIFLSIPSFQVILRQTAIIATLACGINYTLIGGEIDLSVASTAALTAIVVAQMFNGGWEILTVILVALLIGVMIGIANGLIVSKTRASSLLVTLGMMIFIRGLCFVLSGGINIPIYNDTFQSIWATGSLFNIPTLVIWMVVIYIVSYFILHKTLFGLHTFSLGGSETSTFYSGINTSIIKIKLFILSGVIAVFAGFMLAGRTGSGMPTALETTFLYAVAAPIIGGTALGGGKGSFIAPFIGALILSALAHAVIILGYGVGMQLVVQGAVVVYVVVVSGR